MHVGMHDIYSARLGRQAISFYLGLEKVPAHPPISLGKNLSRTYAGFPVLGRHSCVTDANTRDWAPNRHVTTFKFVTHASNSSGFY